MGCYTREQIETTMESKGYKYFTGGDLDVNIIGIIYFNAQVLLCKNYVQS